MRSFRNLLLPLLLIPIALSAQTPPPAVPLSPVPIDFSVAGYQSGKPLPFIPAKLAVAPTGADDTALIQSALDRLATLALDANGFRGALLLRAGTFHLTGQLHLNASGVVLRGSGPTTILLADGISRRTLIEAGATTPTTLSSTQPIASETVPTGATTFTISDTSALAIGDRVVITRPSTPAWIHDIVMTGLPGTFANARIDWTPGSHNLVWDRIITAIDSSTQTITIDAPITTALETRYGGGTIARVQSNPPLQNIAIENLTLDSDYDESNSRDEEHAWIAIALDHVEDAWVRNVTARHFVSSAVRAGSHARRVTIQDSRSESPISEPAGYRRQSFLVYGQQVLVLRCHSQSGMNDFATGLLAAGPNVFLDDDATASLEASGAFEGWASGVLYERVHIPDSRIQLLHDQSRAQAAGWTAANSLIWNSTARTVDAIGPTGALNYVVNSPRSLYETQLAARKLHLSRPSPPHIEAQLTNFTDVLPYRKADPAPHPFQIVNGRFVIDGKVAWGQTAGETWWRGNTSPAVAGQLTGFNISRFMPGQTGPGLTEDLPELAARLKSRGDVFYQSIPGLWYEHRRDEHTITRQPSADAWAPFYEMPWARSGKGTAWDGLSLFDLSKYNPWYFARQRMFAKAAAANGLIVIHHLYNNHNVLEIGPHWIDYPWRPANNINETGLPEPPPLKPDHRKIDPAEIATVDALRLDVGNQFFSVDNIHLRRLHHDYITHVLDELGDQPNVIFTLAYQYAGPLTFEQFFQDTVAEWEKAHNKKIRIALITDRLITDAILTDPVRSRQIVAVDMRYWQYRPDGALWSPTAGHNQSYREQIMLEFFGWTNSPPPTTPEQVYRQVREYRDRYPNIALFPMESGNGPLPILMAGAASQSSLHIPATPPPTVPTVNTGTPTRSLDATLETNVAKFIHDHLATDLMHMSPRDMLVESPTENWVLADDAKNVILVDSRAGATIHFTRLSSAYPYNALWFDPATATTRDAAPVSSNAATIDKPDTKEWLLLLRANIPR